MKTQSIYNSKIYSIYIYIIFFFYLYSIEFIGVPLNLGTRVILGLIGLIVYLVNNKKINYINKNYIYLYVFLIIISLYSLISIVYNRSYDIEFFLKYPISIIIILSSSYYVKKIIINKYKEKTFEKVIEIFINAVVIQIIISLIMFTTPIVRDFLTNIQVNSEYELAVLNESINYRLNGFGARFFGAGIVNGFALIFIATLLKKTNKDTKTLYLTIKFIFIFIFGMAIARTTIIGFILSLVVLFYPQKTLSITKIKTQFKFIFFIITIPILVFILLLILFPNSLEKLQSNFEFGFELILNSINSKSFETESTNQMLNMYIWPSTFKTYLIGDGLYTDPVTKKYYMGTDIGYLRLIYYFGIIGLISYFIFQIVLIKSIYKLNREYKFTFIIIFIYLITLNFKGFTDFFYICILFLYSKSTQNNLK